ncbi:protein DipZ [Frondihabitans sucicola]|uniref:Protein DipZ n=1 Tax=Frondihabitans sucicola TaxID=1268041 RepID=A0ABN6XZT1_9MICO|nr:protein DipZ [Frondihabitans sucicola]
MITLIFLGLVGGLITGISPCILPVLTVIFLSGGAQGARPDGAGPGRRPFLVVLGLAISFSLFTLLGTLVLSALPIPEDIIRWIGLAALILLGIGMIVPRFQHLLEKPFSWVPQRQVGTERGGFLLGLTLGAVYVPCAGPVLAAITVAGATGRIGLSTVVLTVAFAVGTAAPLLFFALAGRGVAERVKAFRIRQRAIRVGAGVVVLALAVALAFNATDAIQRAIPDYTAALNHDLEGTANAGTALSGGSTTTTAKLASCQAEASYVTPKTLRECGPAPKLTGLDGWFDTSDDSPVTLASLRGKVVLVDFWAYSCINCQRAIQHVEQWYKTYSPHGFVVIGVHTPEYAFEHVHANVVAGAKRLGITYPVAQDNDYSTWNAYNNTSWPADYLIDSTGKIRHVSIGEGDYPGIEGMIRDLLKSADPAVALPAKTKVDDTTPTDANQTPETYLGTKRASNYSGSTPLTNGTTTFTAPTGVAANTFALDGTWKAADEDLTSESGSGISLAYTASKVYLDVGGTGTLTVTSGGKTSTLSVSGPRTSIRSSTGRPSAPAP